MKSQPQRLHTPSQQPVLAATYLHVHEALVPLQAICNAFNHRHRNQHRASHWWSEFNILRRAARKLTSDALRRHGPAMLSRARWMKNHVVPRSYLTFTQLAADNQHAPLGLMLLAVLACVNTVLSDLLPEPAQTPEAEINEPIRHGSGAGKLPRQDKGTAISRQDLLTFRRDSEVDAASRGIASPAAHAGSLPGKPEKKKSSKKKMGSKKGDEWSSLFGTLN